MCNAPLGFWMADSGLRLKRMAELRDIIIRIAIQLHLCHWEKVRDCLVRVCETIENVLSLERALVVICHNIRFVCTFKGLCSFYSSCRKRKVI